MASTADRSGGGASAGLLAASGVVAVLFAAPLFYLVRENVVGDGDLWSTYTSSRTLEPLRNTLLLATATAASSAVVGTGLAWLTTRSDLPLRRFWAAVTPLPLVFPSFVGALGLLAALAPGGLLDAPYGWFGAEPTRPEGFWGAWLVLTLFTSPYVLLPVAARLIALPPSLEESARVLGRGSFTVFRTVVVPQIRTAVLAGSLLVFLYAVSDFGVVVMLRYDTLTRAIRTTQLSDPARSSALSLLLGLVALTVVAGERRIARRAPAIESARAKRPLQVPLGRWRWPAFGLVTLWIGLALGGPLASLALWAWRGMSGTGSDLAGSTGDDLLGPALNTAAISWVTALVAVAVVLPLAYLSARYRSSRAGGAATGLVAAGFALPGLVVALAVLSLALEVPESWGLYESFTLLVFAYVVHLGAQSLRAAQVAVAAVPQRLDESAQMLGAGRVRRFATIDLPLMLPGLAAGGGLVLLSTMKELPITLLVAPTGFETLATRIWDDTESGFLAEAGVASLVLVAVSGVLTWLLVTRRTERLA